MHVRMLSMSIQIYFVGYTENELLSYMGLNREYLVRELKVRVWSNSA